MAWYNDANFRSKGGDRLNTMVTSKFEHHGYVQKCQFWSKLATDRWRRGAFVRIYVVEAVGSGLIDLIFQGSV